MELKFKGDSLYWNAYTSRLGLLTPTRHMTFKGYRANSSLATDAATKYGFPKNEIA